MTAALNILPARDQALDSQAHAHAMECLLNCYLREYALPRHQANLDERGWDLPMSLRQGSGRCISLRLPSGRLVVRIDRASLLGRCRFVSAPYFKGNSQGWRPLDAYALARLLCTPLSQAHRVGELLQQIANSLHITRTFLSHSQGGHHTSDTLLASEQHQVWGHALHPTPNGHRLC